MTATMGTALKLEVVDGIAVLTFDLPGESINKFSPAVIEERIFPTQAVFYVT